VGTVHSNGVFMVNFMACMLPHLQLWHFCQELQGPQVCPEGLFSYCQQSQVRLQQETCKNNFSGCLDTQEKATGALKQHMLHGSSLCYI